MSFADDVVCIGTSPQRLQILLNCAYDYSLRWRFEFNPLKSVILCYKNELEHVFNLGDNDVNILTETRHLGILRTVDLSPSSDIQLSCTFPTKFQWKNIVSSAVNPIERLQKEERMRRDNDFVKFLRLSENNNYDFLWQYAKISGRLLTAKHIAKLWTTPPTSGNCKLCGHFVLDILNHQICMCTELQSQRLSLYNRLTELTSFNFMYTTVSKSDESFSDLLLGNHEDLCDILIPEHRLEVLNEGFSFLKYCRL
ncbi:unnamed protein product [Mytilus edulis]|uniref:Reverse transcriptase domain-containing protein n=1 Tax=Mytilus edulis TaxID=6550 RepID=A0A8S3QJ67_MYTED|nr:unnamed protein product [Mytilus edulis]